MSEPAFYRPRRPEESPVNKILVDHFDEFERVYPEWYQERYGFWRLSIIMRCRRPWLQVGILCIFNIAIRIL